MIRRRRVPSPPPLPVTADKRSELAAALLFTVTPSDRALAGWSASEWAAIELEQLGVITAGEVARER